MTLQDTAEGTKWQWTKSALADFEKDGEAGGKGKGEEAPPEDEEGEGGEKEPAEEEAEARTNKKKEKKKKKRSEDEETSPASERNGEEAAAPEKKKAKKAVVEEEPPKKAEQTKAAPAPQQQQQLRGGVVATTLKAGTGAVAKPGSKIKVEYVGTLAKNGRRFDKGKIDFKLGKGDVIAGWDVGCAGMRVGEKRRLHIPAKMGYGKRGAPPDIPPNAALNFDVTLLKV